MGHRLKDHDGKCRGMHGHTYRLQVEFSGLLVSSGSSRGMVADFGVLKAAVRKVKQWFDHAMVLESVDPACDVAEPFAVVRRVDNAPTAEYLASMILAQICAEVPPAVATVSMVRLWESEATYAEVRP